MLVPYPGISLETQLFRSLTLSCLHIVRIPLSLRFTETSVFLFFFFSFFVCVERAVTLGPYDLIFTLFGRAVR